MKISIENFKSIKKLHRFEIKPFTVLSGVNSAGKSSFIQLLLLMKQTIELDSSKQPLFLNGEFYNVRDFKDIISNKDLKRKLKISFEFSKAEFNQIDTIKTVSIFNSFGDYKCVIKIEYDINQNDAIYISEFSVKFIFEDNEDHFIICKSNSDNTFSINTKSAIFGKILSHQKPTITNIHYSSIYPEYYESKKIKVLELGDHTTKEYVYSKELINIEDIKTIINSFFQNISYIEPNRNIPKDEYKFSRNHKNVGTQGEFVAQILEEHANDPIAFYKIIEKENKTIYKEDNKTLTETVKYWMCDIFKAADNIKSEKTNETYKVILSNKPGLETSIKHVGFGISQLLPIIVEGLRMPNNGTLIIEQPEIHLHPKIQSQLYDFLYGLTLQGKKVIIETHSSHFITRMRRRIAENENNAMHKDINLTFIEDDIFRTIELDDYGTITYYPDNFIEESNSELRAIIKAQMIKRTKNG